VPIGALPSPLSEDLAYLVLHHRVHDPHPDLGAEGLDLTIHFTQQFFHRPAQRQLFFASWLPRVFAGDFSYFSFTLSHGLVLLLWLLF
jgi:hypothetical protein